jgi:hypothetical protein
MEPSPFPLSSRAKPRDLQFRGPFLEMFSTERERGSEISSFTQNADPALTKARAAIT